MTLTRHESIGLREIDQSTPTRIRALILEDSRRDAELCIRELKKAGIEVEADLVDTEDAFVQKLQSREYDVVLSDYGIPTWSGVEAFRRLKQTGKNTPFILITGMLGEEAAVDLIKEGIADYILKDRLVRLPSAVRRAMQEKTTRDERERALLALYESEERFRLLLDSAAEAIYGIDLRGDCTFCNAACTRLLGYDNRDSLLGKQMHSLIHHTRSDGTPYPEKECRIYEALQKGEGTHVDDEVLWRKDGTNFSAEYWSYPMFRSGTQIGAVVTFLDITERKKAEERFQKAFNANPEPITIATVAEGRYIDVNESFLRVTGYEREEVIGRTSLELKFWERPEDRARFFEILKKQGSVRNLEITYLTKSGERRTGLDSAEVIEVAGEKCVIAIFRDFTEQKFLEKQLRQAQKMEAVGQLAGGIAHDFNNLLGVIIGYSEILEERLDRNHPLRPKAAQIKKAGQSAAGLTRQLLAFSRQQMLEPKVLDLNAILADTLKMLQRLIGEDIELITIPGPALGRVKVDPGQIEQIVMNLVVNARDAMPQGGRLIITVANAKMDEVTIRQHPGAVPGSYVMLTVSDTGCGMDQETQTRIFEPFFTTKEVGKGTGLGLSTVYGVVKQSGGYISVYSEPGRGTTFKIYFPRIEEAMTASEPDTSGKEIGRGRETILLVEDAQALRELAHELLEDSGYTVLEAADGADAIRVAEQYRQPILLLITDVVMPGMDGRKLAGHMAHSYPGMKVLYMSGYTADAIAHHGVLDSGLVLLQKPFTRESLNRKVREVLESTRGNELA
jgi:two-component system cell cycle sensor histidine kinase/response regulator CckA